MDDATLAGLRTAASAVLDVGFATMAGALATLALLQDTSSDWAARGARGARLLFTRASLLALAASLAWMAVQAISMSDLAPADALLSVGGVVAETAFGRAWAVATLALVACVAIAQARRYRPVPLRILGVATTVVAVAHASAGHAGANGFGWLVPAMAVHLLATGLWAGGVFAAVLAVLHGTPHPVDGVRYARRLSALATAALAGVVATGLASAWHGLGGSLAPLAADAGSPWGRMLDVKLALIACAVALGGFNRFAVMPSLPAAWPRFALVLRVEAAVLLAVLGCAAFLANGEPPAM
jgi:putative copper resistance protein D